MLDFYPYLTQNCTKHCSGRSPIFLPFIPVDQPCRSCLLSRLLYQFLIVPNYEKSRINCHENISSNKQPINHLRAYGTNKHEGTYSECFKHVFIHHFRSCLQMNPKSYQKHMIL